MKIYKIIRDIVFFVLLVGIFCCWIYIAKMTQVIDENIIYINRKVPRVEHQNSKVDAELWFIIDEENNVEETQAE